MSQTRAEVGTSSFISIVANGTRVLVSLATTILVSRWLGASDFGDASFIISSIAFLYYLLACGFDHSLPFFVSRLLSDGQTQAAKQTLKIALFCSLAASVVAGLAICLTLTSILATFEKAHLYWPMLIFLMQMPIGALANIIGGFLRGEKRFLPSITKDQILLPLGTMIGAFVFIKFLNKGVSGFGLAQLMGFSTGLLYIVYVYLKTPRMAKATPAGNFDVKLTETVTPSGMIRFSFPVGLANAIEPLMLHSSIVVGGLFFAAADVGRFSACFRIAFFGQFFLQSIVPIFSPYISEFYKRGELAELKNLHHHVQFWCAKWALFFGFAVLVAGQYMMAPFGAEFAGSEHILMVLTLGCMIEGILGGARQSLLMIGRNFLNLLDFALAALFNIVFSYFLSQKFGILGLAAAFSATLFTLNVLRTIQMWRLSGIRPMSRDQTLYLVYTMAIFIATSGLIRTINLSQASFIGLVLILLSGAFIALFWRDRDLVRKVLRRGQ